jgi:transposase InsO family protein
MRSEMMEIETFEQLEKMIDKGMRYYNNKRLHTSLDLQSPKDFTFKLIL